MWYDFGISFALNAHICSPGCVLVCYYCCFFFGTAIAPRNIDSCFILFTAENILCRCNTHKHSAWHSAQRRSIWKTRQGKQEIYWAHFYYTLCGVALLFSRDLYRISFSSAKHFHPTKRTKTPREIVFIARLSVEEGLTVCLVFTRPKVIFFTHHPMKWFVFQRRRKRWFVFVSIQQRLVILV